MKQINQNGLNAIEQFLKRRHKNGPDYKYPEWAWVDEAERTGKIILKSYMSNDGQVHVLQLSKSSFEQTGEK
jgi:hypothetical protein